MSIRTQPMLDPLASIEEKVADSIGGGFLSSAEGNTLILSVDFAEQNSETIQKEYPGKVISLVMDDALPDGVAMFPGATAVETEYRAKQVYQKTPIVTIDPFQRLVDLDSPFLETLLYQEAYDQLAVLAKDDKSIQALLLQDTDDQENIDRFVEKALDRLIQNLSDADIAKIFKPQWETIICVGGYIQAGKKKNYKSWIIDTGATHTTISQKNFDKLKAKGAVPTPGPVRLVKTANGIVELMTFTGIDVRFPRTGNDGQPELVGADCPIQVGSVNLLGLDQLRKTMTTLTLDPTTLDEDKNPTVTLKAPPKALKPEQKK